MAKVFDAIDPSLREWIAAQPMFFVATAPLAADGHVNLSPKGQPGLAVLGDRQVAYLDLVGSGAETIAHVGENGRIVVMLCAFEGRPRIVRLHGTGRAIEPADPDFASLAAHFPKQAGTRAVIVVDVARVADSCGYGVPLMAYQSERTQLDAWVDRKGEEGLRTYQQQNNRVSLDGLPALRGPK
jgi:predicted pyridoxine 5'-phosphate oxidase superfamily flavin-nucleotide-binding protein